MLGLRPFEQKATSVCALLHSACSPVISNRAKICLRNSAPTRVQCYKYLQLNLFFQISRVLLLRKYNVRSERIRDDWKARDLKSSE